MWKRLAIFGVIVLGLAVLGLAVYVGSQDELYTREVAQKAAALHQGASSANANEMNSPEKVPGHELYAPSWYGWYGFFRWPYGTTAWAIILTLIAIVEQTKQTRKAAEAALVSANAANTQIQVMQTQAGHMERQTKILEDSVTAAQASADAAKAQIQMMFEKERARLTVTFPDESESMMVWPDKKEEMGSFRIILKNVGGTTAFNITASYDAFASESDSIPRSEELFYLVVPASVDANSWEQTGPLKIDGRFSGDTAPQIFYVYARGVITYSDILRKQPNITKFLIRRTFNRTRPGEAVSNEFWESVGDPGDNESA